MFAEVPVLQFKNLSRRRWETINSRRFVGNPFWNFDQKSVISATGGQYFIFQMPIRCNFLRASNTENRLEHYNYLTIFSTKYDKTKLKYLTRFYILFAFFSFAIFMQYLENFKGTARSVIRSIL